MSKKLLALITISVFPFFANAEEIRDPFAPLGWGGSQNPSTENLDADSIESMNVTPLTKDPLATYQLGGVIVSPTDSIALIRTRSKRDYFVNIGDEIGMERGIIDVISSDGITIDVNGKLIDLTVSNGFEIKNENE
ncbi:MAG: pilus assembly protein PilP [Rickettsiales bacterium]|nr:pilus assembly protein PilP [Pseudomonadota bacterium]MDA0966098.1 pilus assembly protein PilP [Pseudomonadota bacterium]MDG4543237.1 pilus assembly protein PilP [Rickettsiales bacterium]MDG4545435.1 pilus assembly protein PilP [Rickettsiales bacterium]MDG4547884.1 pilus assembly protein PilP [Rickettsiales bacterium]